VCNNYCLHGGECTKPESCTCAPGYSGKRCEKSACKPDCMNGGTCNNGTCECLPGYSGQSCRIGNLCALPADNGPCLSEIQDALSPSKKTGLTQACANYLSDLQNSCSIQTTSSNFGECGKICGNVDSICTNLWRNTKCGTEVLKYFFNSATNTCQPFKYYSCLGNENKFDSLEQCNEMCGQNTKQKREISNRTRMVSKTKANHFETIVQRLNDVVRQPSR